MWGGNGYGFDEEGGGGGEGKISSGRDWEHEVYKGGLTRYCIIFMRLTTRDFNSP
jgi:hypothetical protein